jgi:hypothetical protein
MIIRFNIEEKLKKTSSRFHPRHLLRNRIYLKRKLLKERRVNEVNADLTRRLQTCLTKRVSEAESLRAWNMPLKDSHRRLTVALIGVKRGRTLLYIDGDKDELAPPLKRQRFTTITNDAPEESRTCHIDHAATENDGVTNDDYNCDDDDDDDTSVNWDFVLSHYNRAIPENNCATVYSQPSSDEIVTQTINRRDSLCYSDSDDDYDVDSLVGLDILDLADDASTTSGIDLVLGMDNNDFAMDHDEDIIDVVPMAPDTTDNEDVVEAEVPPPVSPPTQQVRRSRRLAIVRTRSELLPVLPPTLRRSPRLALLPRISYVGMC